MNENETRSFQQEPELIMRLIQEHWAHLRHQEVQFVSITNLTMLVVAVILGLFGQFSASAQIILACFVLALGLYGLLLTAKYYELGKRESHRVGALYVVLDSMLPELKIVEVQQASLRAHAVMYPRLRSLKIYGVWVCLHAVIIAVGTALLIMVLYN